MKINIIRSLSVLLGLILTTSCSKDTALSGILSNQITVSTQPVTDIGQQSATAGVQVSGGFSEDIQEKGICYSTAVNPTIQQNKRSGSAGNGTASISINNLIPSITYYVRGYVTTAQETIYGEQRQFTTLGYQLAMISTSSVTNITLTSAITGGNVIASGGGAVNAKGVCWNTTGAPTIANSRTNDGTGLGAYTSNLSGLAAGTTYYVRAYATNQAGTVYGAQVSFMTTSIQLPSPTSTSISSIGLTSASFSAGVTTDGGGTVTAKGVCWSTSFNPTTANARTLDGSGTGTFYSFITGLNAGTTYYVRAYATNQAGTAYGPQTSFTTSSIQLATVNGVFISNITRSTANVSGSVTADGGGTVTSRGLCWSTNSNPTITTNSYTSSGSGIGTVSATLSGLLTGTTYYVRAYAVNAAGTSYGTVSSFRTL